MNVPDLRAAVSVNGGIPTKWDIVGLLRQLVTAYGGTPTKWSIRETLREAVTAAGGTPTQWSQVGLMRELVTALGVDPAEYAGRTLSKIIAQTAKEGATAPVNTAAPTVSGTGSVGQTLTRTAGTWTGADSVSGQWRRDSVAISGATASTYVVQTADAGAFIDYYETALKGSTPAYKGSNGIAIAPVTATDGLYNGNNNSASTIAGTAPGATFPNATAIATAYPDLSISAESSLFTIANTGQLQYGGVATGSRITKTMSGTDWVMSWKAGGTSLPRLIWDYVDDNNYRFIQLALGDTSFKAQQLVAGVQSDITNAAAFGGSFAGADTFELGRTASTMYLKRNGAQVGASWTAARVNDVIGFRSRGATMRWDDWLIQSTLNPITIGSATVDNDGFYAVAGNYTSPTPTAIEIRRFTSDGTLLADWETCTGTISGGTFSVKSATKASSSAYGTTVRVQIRASNNTGVTRSALVAVPLFQAVFTFVKGMNEGNLSTAGLQYSRDIMQSARYSGTNTSAKFLQKGWPASGINIPDSQSGIGYDGTIQSYATADTAIKTILPDRLPATGSYTLNYPPGMTLSAQLNGRGSLTSNNSATGTAVFNFTAASWLINEVVFTFSGGTNGSLNFKPTMTRDADPNPSRTYADARKTAWDGLTGTAWIRNMDPSGVNLDQVTRNTFATEQWTGPINMGFVPVQQLVAFANATNQNLRLNISHKWSSSYIAGYAAYVAANLNSGLKVAVELSNEVWNRITFSQGHDLTVQGCALGLWNTNGNASPITIRTDGINASPYYGTTNGDLTASFSTGEYVYANFGGWRVFVALKNNVAGSADNLSNASAWAVAITDAEGKLALKRRYADLSVAMFNAFDAAFTTAGYNPRDRVVRLFCWQAGTGDTDARQVLSWNDAWQNYDEFNIAPYWGGGVGGYELGNYDSNYTGWGATEKALVATNMTAFVNAFYAIAPTAVDAAVNAARDYKQGLARWLNTTYGVPIDGRGFGSYEAHWHWVQKGGWNAAITTGFQTIVADPRFGTMFTRYAEGLRDKVGGTHCFYVRSQGAWSTMSTQNFGFQQEDSDTTNALVSAYVALA